MVAIKPVARRDLLKGEYCGAICINSFADATLMRLQVTKPVVAWVSGTCAKLFKSEVQFGHAGAKSGGDKESAQVCP